MPETPAEFRTCVDCEYWYMTYEADWSEVTPGEGWRSGCNKDHWRMAQGDLVVDGNLVIEEPDTFRIIDSPFRVAAQKARTCGDYEERSKVNP